MPPTLRLAERQGSRSAGVSLVTVRVRSHPIRCVLVPWQYQYHGVLVGTTLSVPAEIQGDCQDLVWCGGSQRAAGRRPGDKVHHRDVRRVQVRIPTATPGALLYISTELMTALLWHLCHLMALTASTSLAISKKCWTACRTGKTQICHTLCV